MQTDTPLQLSPTCEADFEALLALRIAAMRDSLERIGQFDPNRARQRLRATFSPSHTRHIEYTGERVGFVVTKPHPDGLLLDHLYIHPDHQNKGIGAQVLAIVFAEADAAGLAIRVGALRESASNPFYIRHGFGLVQADELDNYYLRAAPIRP